MKYLKYYTVFILFFLCAQGKSFAQDRVYAACLACINLTYQVDSLMEISKIQTDTGRKFTFKFLICFEDKYSNSAELKEYSDEVLFKLLEKYPKMILEIMSKNKKQIPWKNICEQIAHPINNVNDINEIIKGIGAVSGYSNVKKDVIDALYAAKDRL